MRKVDVSVIEVLAKALDKTVQEYMQTIGTDQENFNLFRMNFIKKFSDDVMFLNDLSGKSDFYHRYGYLTLRNMLEQLIEYLYVQKNKHLVNEYLGLKIDLDARIVYCDNSKIDLTNKELNEIICKNWAVLYHRLLKHFGIKSKLHRIG